MYSRKVMKISWVFRWSRKNCNGLNWMYTINSWLNASKGIMKKLFDRFFSLEILLNWNTSFLVSESSENILDAENSKVLTWAILGEGEGHFQDSKSLRSSNLEREFWLLWYQIWRNSSIFRRNFNALNFEGGCPRENLLENYKKCNFFEVNPHFGIL